MNSKICKTCKVEKPIEEFPLHKIGGESREAHCKLCMNQKNRDWRKANPHLIKPYSEGWQKKNMDLRRKYMNEKYAKLRREVIFAYGSRCAQCGFDDVRALHIDHVDEDGAMDRRRKTPLQHLTWIVKSGFPKNYQLLCANCNTIKACEAGVLRFTPTVDRRAG